MSFDNILFDLFILAIFGAGIYVFLIMPRQREYRKRMQIVRSIKPGAKVLTYGGIVGTLKRLDKDSGIATVEVANGVEMRFLASAITSEFDPEAVAKGAQRALK